MTENKPPPSPFSLPVLQSIEALKLLNPLAKTVPQEELVSTLELTIAQGGGSDLEAVLISQTQLLDALFTRSLVLGVGERKTYYDEDYIDLALRSQRQCREAIQSVRALQGLLDARPAWLKKVQNEVKETK